MVCTTTLLLLCLVTVAMCDPVLRLDNIMIIISHIFIVHTMIMIRYKLDSCNNLSPVYAEENWHYPGGGDAVVSHG